MPANFTVNISSLVVDFIDTSTGSPISWTWDFGDPSSGANNTSNLQNPQHTFTNSGKYTVTLTTFDGVSNSNVTKTLIVSNYTGNPTQISSDKLTSETDDNRRAISSSVIEDINGRNIAFYQKNSLSGRLSNGRVTNPSSLNISVAAGNGIINSTPVVWSSTPLVAQANKFQLVYVNSSGVVNITDIFDMTLMASSILLAYVFAGLTEVTRILEIEKDGKYILVRRQKPDGFGGWIWDNIEEILHSGEFPSSFYDTSLNRIFLTYKKDGAIYQRIIEVGNETNAWDYLLDYTIQAGPQIVLNNNPIAEQFLDASGSDSSLETTDPFPFSWKILGFQTEFLNPGYDYTNKYMFMPYVVVNPDAQQAIVAEPINYQLYLSDNETLNETLDYNSNKLTWKNINLYNGIFYLGWTGFIYVDGRKIPFTLSKRSRQEIYIESTRDEIVNNSPTQIGSSVHQSFISSGSASDAKNEIIETFNQIYDYETDDTKAQPNTLQASASDAKNEIIETFNQIYDYETDDTKAQPNTLQASASDAVYLIV